MIKWARYGGYECSTKGDKRFSALYARLPDGRTIEMHYQCDVKGYDAGGTNWKLGKGKPPINSTIDLYEEYLGLWDKWAGSNQDIVEWLFREVGPCGVLSDCFATTGISQARALADILNNRFLSARTEVKTVSLLNPTPIEKANMIKTLQSALTIIEGLPVRRQCSDCADFSCDTAWCGRWTQNVPEHAQQTGCDHWDCIPF